MRNARPRSPALPPPSGALTLPWLVRACAWLLHRLPPTGIERLAGRPAAPATATRR